MKIIKLPSTKQFVTLLFFTFGTLAFGQQAIHQISLEHLKSHLKILSSDAMAGRATGTPGIEKAAKYLESAFQRMGLKPSRQGYKMPDNSGKACNILAQIEGKSMPSEFVVVSAHYDHLGIVNGEIYNGADDDGSGTAALLAMAETLMELKKQGRGPDRTVVFIAFSGEEKGLWGSDYFSEHPTIDLTKVSCDVNIDMIGRIDPERTTADTNHYVCVVGQRHISSELKLALRALNENTQNLILDGKFDEQSDPNRIFYRSDHYNFAKKGVPAVFFYDGMLGGDYHEPTDDFEKINWDIYQKRCNFILDFVVSVANRADLLKRDLTE